MSRVSPTAHSPLTAEFRRLGESLHPEPPQEETPEPPPTQEPSEVIPPPPHPALTPVWSDPDFRAFTAQAERLGMPADEVVRWLGYTNQAMRQDPPDPEVTIDTLKTEWGKDFDRKLTAARAVTKRLGPAFARFLDDTALGDDPHVICKLAELGRPLVEKVEAIERINSGRALWDARDPGHQRAISERARLFKLLYPD